MPMTEAPQERYRPDEGGQATEPQPTAGAELLSDPTDDRTANGRGSQKYHYVQSGMLGPS